MIEKTDVPNVGTIDLKNGSRIYVNTEVGEYKKVTGKSINRVFYNAEDMVFNRGVDFTKPIQLKTWVCKVCVLDNLGVICSECKKMYNHADPDCFLKE